MQPVLPYLIFIFCVLFCINLLSSLSSPTSKPLRFVVFVLFSLFSLHFFFNFLFSIFTLESPDLILFSIHSLRTLLFSDYHCFITSGYVIVTSLDNRMLYHYRYNYNNESEVFYQFIYFIWAFGQKEYFFFALVLEIAWLRYFNAILRIRNNFKTELITWGVVFWVIQYCFRTWTVEDFFLFGFVNFGSILIYFISLYFFCFINFIINWFIIEDIRLQNLANLDYRSALVTFLRNNMNNYLLMFYVAAALGINIFIFILSELYFENYWKNFSYLSIFGFSYFVASFTNLECSRNDLEKIVSNTLSIGLTVIFCYFIFQ